MPCHFRSNSKQINVPSNGLDNEFIIAVERATFSVPILSDVPAPPALDAASLRPSWYPPVNFGQDRGPPGVFTEQNSAHSIEQKNKEMFGEYHGGSGLIFIEFQVHFSLNFSSKISKSL